MNQQEAYRELARQVAEIRRLTDLAQSFAADYGLVLHGDGQLRIAEEGYTDAEWDESASHWSPSGTGC